MKFIIIIYTTNKLTIVEMEDIRGVRLRKFKLRKIILGVRMHFRHIFPGQDKAVPSFGKAVEEWKPPDKIYTIDNAINTILHYMLGFFSFSFFYYSLLPPLFSPLYFLFFNPSSFLIIFLHLFSYYFLIFSDHHKTQQELSYCRGWPTGT